jgi:magnesium chelatase subunit D
VRSVVIDTSQRPAEQSRKLAVAMSARYLPLPHADAAAMSQAVRAVIGDGASARSA